MSKHKKDKKQKKKQKQFEKIKEVQKKFDILELLKTENIDTKPNFAKFLDQYVERIAAVVKNGKIQFYPVEECSLIKVLVMFLDKHELIYDENVLQGHSHYYMYDDLVEIPLTQNDISLIENFFNLLFQFKFVHSLKND